MNRLPWLWPLIIVVSAITVSLVNFAEVLSPLRPLIAFWFLVFCPGLAFVPLLRLKDSFAEWTLAVALSLALDTIVATTMLYAELWSPRLGLVVLVGISLVGAILQIGTGYRRKLAPILRSRLNRLAPGQAAITSTISLRMRWKAAVGGLVLLALLFLFGSMMFR